MKNVMSHWTTFNAGDIVPIMCEEVLPHSSFSVDLDFVIRQSTVLVPSMGQMFVDVFSFFVPNRVVNKSWKMVMGENTSGDWTANEVSLAPLLGNEVNSSIQIPVGSVADYYGYPTQMALPASVLRQCHDLKIRGYLECYNNYFRDQNYQPAIPSSKLNVYNGFLRPVDTAVSLNPAQSGTLSIGPNTESDGSTPRGAIVETLYGSGNPIMSASISLPPRLTSFSALDKPLKANKMHDYFTSGLPSPQKGLSVTISSLVPMPVVVGAPHEITPGSDSFMSVKMTNGSSPEAGSGSWRLFGYGEEDTPEAVIQVNKGNTTIGSNSYPVFDNLYADPEGSSVTLNDLRMSAAMQQVYEILGRGGSRYVEYINSFFGLDIDNPFDDIPTLLGHFRRELDLFQTAQTSASTDQSAQGNLAAFGYTNKGGHVLTYTAKEHGYIHTFVIVRHKNIYSSLLTRDNFRRSMLDFYQYPLANISEQPVYTREINPFAQDPSGVWAYQEAWAEYRMMPDRVSGLMRPGIDQSLAVWNYADNFNSNLSILDGTWLESNSASVLNRSVAITDSEQPQFKAQFVFRVTKELPMPTYSVAGLDII